MPPTESRGKAPAPVSGAHPEGDADAGPASEPHVAFVVRLQAITQTGEVTARENLAEWDKDYAKEVLSRIVQKG